MKFRVADVCVEGEGKRIGQGRGGELERRFLLYNLANLVKMVKAFHSLFLQLHNLKN